MGTEASTPLRLIVANLDDQPLDSWVSSSIALPHRTDGPPTVTVASPDTKIRVCGRSETWATDKAAVKEGDVVDVQWKTAAKEKTVTTARLIIGDMHALFNAETGART